MEKTDSKTEFKSNYYASALFNIARAEGEIDRAENELAQLSGEVMRNLDLKKYLTDPAIQKPDKIKSLLIILGEESTRSIKAFASIAIIMDALESIDRIYRDYVEITNRFRKQVSVEVISAIELDDALLEEIKKDVDSKTGLDVRVKNTIDSAIIGGMVIKIGERVIDLSVKNKIRDLKSKLKALELRGEDFGFEN